MSPMISNSAKEKRKFNDISKKDFQNEKNKLLKLRKYIENNFDYVGENFSQKVREIYYDKKSNKAIYGTTTSEEKKELAEEGIDLISIPWVNKDN
tara:strand:- start:562 stop:846 length:285 start_codon:yes stop_codon:yes gene_type:complete